MGIIMAVLFAGGILPKGTPLSLFSAKTSWIVLSCHAAMGLGTALGGWRIVRTMGMKLTKLRPVGGFCAETAGAITLFMRDARRHPGVDDAHHHRRDRRRRLGDDEAVGGALGRGQPHRVGVALHHPGVGRRGGGLLQAERADHGAIGFGVQSAAEVLHA